ncbi:hypothetical protein [Siccibacter turicensis]
MSLNRVMSFIILILSMIMALYISYLYQPVPVSNLLAHVRALFMDENNFFIAAITMASMSGLLAFLIKYINKENPTEDDRSGKHSIRINSLEESISAIQKKLNLINVSGEATKGSIELSNDERAMFLEEAKKKIAGHIVISATEKMKAELGKIKELAEIGKHYEKMSLRLEKEIARLNHRGGINLGIGAVIAVFGIAYLGYAISNQAPYENIVIYLGNMVPRFTFVVVIEVFAYFFLKLYKNGFEQVKYFQNELTNVDSKVLGIKFLKDIKNEELMNEVIKSLMSTERNFILEKGQTTVGLEKEKMDMLENKGLMQLVKELIKK